MNGHKTAYLWEEVFIRESLANIIQHFVRLDGSAKDPLDEIIRTFNERWFQGWSATPEEQRVKFVNIADSIKAHSDFESKYQNNPDPHNRGLAFEKMLKEIMLNRRKDELELYKLFANDPAFKASWRQSMEQLVSQNHEGKS